MLLAAAVLATACGSDGDESTAEAEASPTATEAADAQQEAPITDSATDSIDDFVPATDRPIATTTTTTTPPPSTTTTTTTTTTSTTTTTTTSTTTLPIPVVPGALDLDQDFVGLGFSVEGRPIFAERYGTPGGRRVLVIGVIHGNEQDGLLIVDELRRREVPEGLELWLVESMNPDGVVVDDRHNANDVDLNRNFPYNWGPIGVPGDGQYAGTGPASEIETQVMVNFLEQLRPDISIWYHQDAFLIIPGTGRSGRIKARYAELTGLPLADCCGTGGIYTGIAATWANQELEAEDAVSFIVELGATTSPEEVSTHADAALTVFAEG